MPEFPSEKSRQVFALLLIAAVSLAVYGNTLPNAFVYDDCKVVVENRMIRNWSNIVHLFDSGYFRKAGELSYRPVVTLSYFLDYSLWKLKSAGYHLTNLLWHTLNGLLLYLLLRVILKKPGVALAAALLFVVHPVTSEAVDCVGFREDLLAAGFSLLAFFFYLRSSPAASRRRWWYLGCWAAFAGGIFSKENALVLPLLFLLYEFAFSDDFSRKVKEKLSLYAGLLLILIFYLPVRFVLLTHSETLRFYPPVLYHRLLTMSRIFFYYLGLLLFPRRLSAEYTYPVSSSLLEPRVFLSVLGVLLLLGLTAFSYRRRAFFFAAGWFFLTLAPVANFIPLYNPAAERYLYIPVMGFALLLALVGDFVFAHWKSPYRYAVPGLLAALVCAYGFRTVVRNRDWRDHFTFLQKTIATCPGSAKFHCNLGYMYQQKNMLARAEKELLTALEIDPDYDTAHHNLGSVYKKKGMLAEAVREFKAALKLSPSLVGSYHNLGLIYGMQGRMDEAVEQFQTALKIDPDFSKSHFNLGFCYQRKGMPAQALEEYLLAIELEPDSAMYHYYLGTLYQSQGEMEKAAGEYHATLEFDPGHVRSYNNLGKISAARNDYAGARGYWEKALEIDPSLREALANLDELDRGKEAEVDEGI